MTSLEISEEDIKRITEAASAAAAFVQDGIDYSCAMFIRRDADSDDPICDFAKDEPARLAFTRAVISECVKLAEERPAEA